MEIPLRRRFQDGLHEVENYCLKFNLDWCWLAWEADGEWKCYATEDSVPKKMSNIGVFSTWTQKPVPVA